MSSSPILFWFRHNLRLKDNPALAYAVQQKRPIVFVFIDDDINLRPYGGASRWWLNKSLPLLNRSLAEIGSQLFTFQGDSTEILLKLVEISGATQIIAQRQFEPDARTLESKIIKSCEKLGCEVSLFDGYLLADPDTVKSKTGTPYKVFTPFWKECSQRLHISKPIPAPKKIVTDSALENKIAKLKPFKAVKFSDPIGWSEKLENYWNPGEESAHEHLQNFLSSAIGNYAEGRDVPSSESTSKLSPYLHFGEISPNTVLYEVNRRKNEKDSDHAKSFKSEVGWREFNHHLLWHWPNLAKQPFQPKFKAFPWRKKTNKVKQWEKGLTGIPIVDAGMRELWETGWMHNRVRMIVASLLVKNMMFDWKLGEKWFWDTLVDANMANNGGGWQWVAGCGADAAPYFRIFNPVTQAERFDKQARYIKHWVPELANLPDKIALAPWQSSVEVLRSYQFTLGKDYPEPIVDLKKSRQEALAALEQCNQLWAEETT